MEMKHEMKCNYRHDLFHCCLDSLLLSLLLLLFYVLILYDWSIAAALNFYDPILTAFFSILILI